MNVAYGGIKCDAIKQNESELANIHFISLFFIVFAITQNALSQESIVPSSWGFHQIKT